MEVGVVSERDEEQLKYPARTLKAYLGWANEGTHGGNSLRLYALDRGPSPRWAEGGGRTVERAILETFYTNEGDRYLVIRLGNRFVSDEEMDIIARWIEEHVES
jgi:hypothetical protein